MQSSTKANWRNLSWPAEENIAELLANKEKLWNQRLFERTIIRLVANAQLDIGDIFRERAQNIHSEKVT